MEQFDASKSELSDFKALKFEDAAGLVTYTVKLPGSKPATEHHTTIWANRSGKWLALFHQGTPVMPMPPAKATTPEKAVTPAKAMTPAKPAATKTPAK